MAEPAVVGAPPSAPGNTGIKRTLTFTWELNTKLQPILQNIPAFCRQIFLSFFTVSSGGKDTQS